MKEIPEVSLISLWPVISTSKVLSLEAGPIQSDYRCNTTSFGEAISWCVSTFFIDQQGFKQSPTVRGNAICDTHMVMLNLIFLLNMSMEKPVRLPQHHYLLMKAGKQLLPLLKNKTSRLALWIVSWKSYLSVAFQRKILNLLQISDGQTLY